MQWLYIASGAIGLIAALVLISMIWARREGNEFHYRWVKGIEPTHREFSGVYKIRIYPRWLWWWFVDVKIFYPQYAGAEGLNVAWGIIAWGKRIWVIGYGGMEQLNYEQAWWPWRIIRDYVKRRKDCEEALADIYDGKFCVKLPYIGEMQIAWFTMEKL